MTDQLERFEQYLRGDLDDDLQRELEAELATNQDLQDKLDHYRQVRTAIIQRLEQKDQEVVLQQTLQKMSQEYFSADSRRMTPMSRVFAAASVLLLLVGAFAISQRLNYTDDNLILMGMEERPLSTTRGSEGLYQLPEAVMAYENGEWQEAAQGFLAVEETSDYYVDAQLYAGYALLKNGLFSSAAAAFQRAIDRGTPDQVANAEWHLALTQVPGADSDHLPDALIPILGDKDHPFHQDALDLEAALQSFWR